MSESSTRHAGGGTATAPGASSPSLDAPIGRGGGSGRWTEPRRWISEVIEFVYRLAGSTLATPKVAVGVSLAGIVLIMIVGVLSPNFNTLPPNHTGDPSKLKPVVLPLSGHLFSLPWYFSFPLTYLAIVAQ